MERRETFLLFRSVWPWPSGASIKNMSEKETISIYMSHVCAAATLYDWLSHSAIKLYSLHMCGNTRTHMHTHVSFCCQLLHLKTINVMKLTELEAGKAFFFFSISPASFLRLMHWAVFSVIVYMYKWHRHRNCLYFQNCWYVRSNPTAHFTVV